MRKWRAQTAEPAWFYAYPYGQGTETTEGRFDVTLTWELSSCPRGRPALARFGISPCRAQRRCGTPGVPRRRVPSPLLPGGGLDSEAAFWSIVITMRGLFFSPQCWASIPVKDNIYIRVHWQLEPN